MAVPFLTRACDEARDRVRSARAEVAPSQLREAAAAAGPVPSLLDALAAPGLSVIAEVKRASPSRGPIADIPEPHLLARAYAAGGAAAVSVLTEPRHFRGTLDDLRAVAGAVPLPVLRKDFVVDPYQLLEARAHGASAALLIVAALDDDELPGLMAAAAEIGLDTLVEVHTGDEMGRAELAHAAAGMSTGLIVGVNARNLSTLEVDIGVVEELASARPDGAVLVAESGISGPDEAARVAAAGADAVLVGEHVAIAPDPSAAVAALRTATARSHAPLPPASESVAAGLTETT